MANQITDNRTLVHAADVVTPYDSLAGAAAGTLDTEILIQGTGSIGFSLSSTLSGILYDAGAAQDWSNNVFYIWINCGIVGLLATKAAGGFRIRFAGATVTNWFEVYVAGSDAWPPSVQGGWTQFVVDIEDARAAAITNGWTGGTVPATTAIRYVGWAGVTGGTMPRMVDNTWMDEIRRLPDGSPGIIVEGRNGGATDWSFGDIVTQLGVAAGTAKLGAGGAIVLNTSVQFGINDTTTHGFSDTNRVVLFENQEYAPADLYGFSAVGNAGGTTNVRLGVKSGTGDAATGAQGGSITAAATGVRYFMDFNGANLNSIGFYGVGFNHGAAFDFNSTAVEAITCIYNDCTSAAVADSLQLKNSVVDANTADGVAFMTTDDLGDIRFCLFEFSDGHAIELTTPRVASQDSAGNLFTGYGADGTNDAAIYNNTAGAVTINVLNNGGTPTIRNGASASTTVQNTVTVTVTVKDGTDQSNIQNARVLLTESAEDVVTITRVSTTATVSHTAHGYADGSSVLIKGAAQSEYNGIHTITVTGANDYTYTVSGSPATPATGTINAQFVVLSGLTNVSGVLTTSAFNYLSDLAISGRARKSTSSPFYKTGPVAGTITSAGFSTTVFLQRDE